MSDVELAQRYWAVIDSRRVRNALRQLRGERQSPEEFADSAGVSRATVYRIEDPASKYSPKIETVDALVRASGLTLSDFFARIEGTAPASSAVPDVRPPVQVKDGPAPQEAALAVAVVIGQTIADAIVIGFDRARAARKQAPAPRPRTAKRDASHRKVG